MGQTSILADYHIHTAFSDDSAYALEDVVKDAIRLNIDELCFTDHVDYGVKPEWGSKQDRLWLNKPVVNVNYPEFFKEFERVQEKYQGQICLKKGFEFGIQTHTIPLFEKLYDSYDLDFVLLSIHQVEDQEFWTQEFQKGRTQAEIHTRYYQELYDVICQYKHYSVLGHLDLIRRYDEFGAYPFEAIEPYVRKILTQVIKDGKGIEVNTSSFRYGLKDLMPSTDILKLYLELGGRILTIGSDTHQAEHLGAYIQEVKQQLKALGFTQVYTYTKMQAQAHAL